MAPLILHNVPDEELYVGDDGIKRPYAMVFPQQEGGSFGRSRKAAHESGSFGKSTRRSRSKTGTPARREDPTIAGADRIFSTWAQNQAEEFAAGAAGAQRKASAPAGTAQGLEDGTAPATAQARFKQPEPTEVILRGYRSQSQQYAAINHFEQLAGRICEDYPREPPVESRRYKSELRDPAFTRRRALTTEERMKVNKADGGEHWVKVTFESKEAAETAVFASPQSVLGHLIFAELYHGIPPRNDEAVPDIASLADGGGHPTGRYSTVNASGFTSAMLNQGFDPDSEVSGSAVNGLDVNGLHARRKSTTINASGFTRAMMNPDSFDFSPPQSQSSRTADTSTVDSGTITSGTGTVTGRTAAEQQLEATSTAGKDADEYCKTIPTVRKVKLLPVEQALLPAPTLTQRLLSYVPMLWWFSGAMIGNEVPRTDSGEFDWDKASLYWRFICMLDIWFGLFGKEIVSADKDE
ncbi:hypothetical protein OQA88_7283 [Cercophora sp. LCS_1]